MLNGLFEINLSVYCKCERIYSIDENNKQLLL